MTTTRAFRNSEDVAVEATMTFPVPGEAALVGLRATVDERELVAYAKPRETYEDALDRGKAAVLHEEKLRGVHMLSLGNLAPGKEARVVVTFVTPLSFASDTPTLRIPTTVGDVFGRSPLMPSDDLVNDDVTLEARVTVTSYSGMPVILGLGSSSRRVTLDRSVEFAVAGWNPASLTGRSSDGRTITIDIAPAGGGEADLDLTVATSRGRARRYGRSHSLDFQALASRGSRGQRRTRWQRSARRQYQHLAALTGGQTFVTVGANVEGSVKATLASFRTPATLSASSDGQGLPTNLVEHLGIYSMTPAVEALLRARSSTASRERLLTKAVFAIHMLGRIPSEGQRFIFENRGFEVVVMDGCRIDKVLASRPPALAS